MKNPNFSAMNPAVAEAIERMMAEQGDKFSLEKINLAELERRTGISRARLRHMKEHGFEETKHASKGRKAATTLLSGYQTAKHVQDFHLIPSFSKTRMRVRLVFTEQGRAFATKAGSK